jgi:geranylgeranyl pyrophosphate synthase
MSEGTRDLCRLAHAHARTIPQDQPVERDALAQLLQIPTLPAWLDAVDARLRSTVQPYEKALGPEAIAVITTPGRRLRASLTVAFAFLGNRSDDAVVRGAAAIELVQVGSLIHDDLIDGAATRRGRPTIHSTVGIGPALVAGDLVLALAGQLAVGVDALAPGLLAEGMAQMARGELEELQDLFDPDRPPDRHAAAIRGKTGALFACACRLGAALGNLPPDRQDAATEYGAALGITHQLVDDLIDLVGSSDAVGKPVGADIAAGVYTAPVLHALRTRGGSALRRALGRGGSDGVAEALRIVRGSSGVQHSLIELDLWVRRAEAAARKAGPPDAVKGLLALPRAHALAALERTSLETAALAPFRVPPRARRRSPLRAS